MRAASAPGQVVARIRLGVPALHGLAHRLPRTACPADTADTTYISVPLTRAFDAQHAIAGLDELVEGVDDRQAGADGRFVPQPSPPGRRRRRAGRRSCSTSRRAASCWRARRRSRARRAARSRSPVSSLVTSTRTGRDTAWPAMSVSASAADAGSSAERGEQRAGVLLARQLRAAGAARCRAARTRSRIDRAGRRREPAGRPFGAAI